MAEYNDRARVYGRQKKYEELPRIEDSKEERRKEQARLKDAARRHDEEVVEGERSESGYLRETTGSGGTPK